MGEDGGGGSLIGYVNGVKFPFFKLTGHAKLTLLQRSTNVEKGRAKKDFPLSYMSIASRESVDNRSLL